MRATVQAACFAFAASSMSDAAAAQGILRTELQTINFPKGYVTQVFLITIPPQGSVDRYTEPGVETGYVVSGVGIIAVVGQTERKVRPGDTWMIAPGVVHALQNIGDEPEEILVTYVLRKGQPLARPAP